MKNGTISFFTRFSLSFFYLFRRVIPYLLKRLWDIAWYAVCKKIIICVELTPSIFESGDSFWKTHTAAHQHEPRYISVGWQPSIDLHILNSSLFNSIPIFRIYSQYYYHTNTPTFAIALQRVAFHLFRLHACQMCTQTPDTTNITRHLICMDINDIDTYLVINLFSCCWWMALFCWAQAYIFILCRCNATSVQKWIHWLGKYGIGSYMISYYTVHKSDAWCWWWCI